MATPHELNTMPGSNRDAPVVSGRGFELADASCAVFVADGRAARTHSMTRAGRALSVARAHSVAGRADSLVRAQSITRARSKDLNKMAENCEGPLPDTTRDDILPLTSKQNGTWMSCMFHNVTSMVGAGVLGLPHAFSYLGWAGGPVVLLASLLISWYTFVLLVKMHEQLVPCDEEEEKSVVPKYQRINRYVELSNYVLGKRWGWIIQPFQVVLLWGTAILYAVTGGTALLAVFNNSGGRGMRVSEWIAIFAVISMCVAQIRSFGDLMLVSAMGAVKAACYCTLAIGMSGAYPLEPRAAVSYVTGRNGSTLDILSGTFNSITSIMFAFGGHNIALEIQASLPGGTCAADSTVPRMLLGLHTAFASASLVYFPLACVGWWAYGSVVEGNVLFSLGGPLWVESLADMLVAMHLVACFQVYSFPLYDMMEGRLMGWGVSLTWWKLTVIRAAYVAVTALIACLIPFFGDVMGLVGAAGITATTFVFPCILWLVLRRPSPRTFDFWACWFIATTITFVGVLGAVGSIRLMAVDASTYSVFS